MVRSLPPSPRLSGVLRHVPMCAGLLLLVLLADPAGAFEVCRRVPLSHDGRPVVGPEDLAYDPLSRTLVLSADDRRDQSGGGLYALRLDDLSRGLPRRNRGPVAVRRLWPPAGPGAAAFRPHGIAFDPATRRLAVIDHGTPERLDVFTMDGQGALVPGEPIPDPRLGDANDVIPDGAGGWLVSLDHGSESRFGRVLEDVFGLARGKVIRAGDPQAVVADAILFANGLLRGEAGTLYVSATRAEAVVVFRDGERVRELAVPGGPDNLSRAPDGRILAAVIPSPVRLGLALMGLGLAPPGGRVVAVTPDTGAVEVLFDDQEGTVLRAATSALQVGGTLMIGSVMEPAIAVCE